MTKFALCIKNYDDLQALTQGQVEAIDLSMIDRDICEKAENGWLQVIPYVSMSHLDIQEGRLYLVTYRRPAKGEGEARLQGATSLGFGGHVDMPEDLSFSDSRTEEDGTLVYTMTPKDLITTIYNTARRELKEELGFDPAESFDLVEDATQLQCNVIYDPNADDVGKVHLGFSIKLELTSEQMQEFFELAKASEKEVEELSAMYVDVKRFVTSYNAVEMTKALIGELKRDKQIEDWSEKVIVQHLSAVIDIFQRNLPYEVMVQGVHDEIDRRIQEDSEKALAAEDVELKSQEQLQAVEQEAAQEVSAEPAAEVAGDTCCGACGGCDSSESTQTA